eukprot:XP_001695676.1 predicted protein [Chlamydomonas reinhardtii]
MRLVVDGELGRYVAASRRRHQGVVQPQGVCAWAWRRDSYNRNESSLILKDLVSGHAALRRWREPRVPPVGLTIMTVCWRECYTKHTWRPGTATFCKAWLCVSHSDPYMTSALGAMPVRDNVM